MTNTIHVRPTARGGATARPGLRTVCRALSIVIGLLAGLVLFAPLASAHPTLLFTEPAVESATADSPTSVSLVFNEPVLVGPRAISVVRPDGSAVAVGQTSLAREGRIATAQVMGSLRPGTYLVRWRVTGTDQDIVEGEFRFAVGTGITVGDGGTSSGQGTLWLPAALRWVLFTGLALMAGGLVAQRFTTTARTENPALPIVAPWSALGGVLGLGAVVALGVPLVIEGGSLAALWQSTPGQVLLAEAGGFLAAMGLQATGRGLWALVPLTAVAIGEGLRSHANAEVPLTGALLVAVHVAAAALWVGALLHTVRAVVAWRSSRAAVTWVLLSYTRLASWVLLGAVATGLVTAVLLVPPSAVTTTAYGQILLIKLIAVVVVVALALAARRSLAQQRLDRVLRFARGEGAVLIGVLAVSAALVSTPTPGAISSPPPAARGPVIPSGGLAGQAGVSVAASDGQLVARLATPRRGDYYGPAEQQDYKLSGQTSRPGQPPSRLQFRPCGPGCFVAPVAWNPGENVLSLRVEAPGWHGDTFATRIPWPTRPADDLVRRTADTMRGLGRFTIYEAVTSDTTSGPPEPVALQLDGPTFLPTEPYSAGIAPISADLTRDGGPVRFAMSFPAEGRHAEVTLDAQGRISDEVLSDPKHFLRRHFVYPEQ